MKNIKQNYRRVIRYFNSFINKILLTNFIKKTNQNYKRLARFFNFIINKILLKNQNQTNNFFFKGFEYKISNFNKYLITLIALLFIYLFYLSIPTLYDKTWVQNTIEAKLLNEFNINFSISSQISYEILPSPHFIIKNAKILDDNDNNPKELSEIKKLSVFISQKNFFNKDSLKIKKVLINDANFTIQKKDFKFFKKIFNKKFSHKKIIIKNSSIFFKDFEKETVTITKIKKLFLFYDNLKFLNVLQSKAEIFNIPFDLELDKEFSSPINKTSITIESDKLRLKFFNELYKKLDNNSNIINGLSSFSTFDSQIITSYEYDDNLILLKSKKSASKNYNVRYQGKINLDPFNLDLEIDLGKTNLKKSINLDSIIWEIFKSKLLFNNNISANISIKIRDNTLNNLFNTARIFLNINNGVIDFNKSQISNDKIALLEALNSKLFIRGGDLIFNSDFFLTVSDSNKFFSFLQTPTKLRRPIKDMSLNIEYNFSNNSLSMINFKIDNSEPGENVINILDNFNKSDNQDINNFIKNRSLFFQLLEVYEG